MNIKPQERCQRGEGESGFILTLLVGAICVSAIYYGIHWVLEIKDARNRRHAQEVQRPAPKSIEDIGGYQTTVYPIL